MHVIWKIIGVLLVVLVAAVAVFQTQLRAVAYNYWPPHRAVTVDEELAARGLARGVPVYLRIFKEEHELELWVSGENGYSLLRTYPICAWSGTLGPKLQEGDGQSPEGFYRVRRRDLNPNSQFHLSFNLGFPNAYDRAHGRTGSYLMVHGNCVSIGCYAMTDEVIETIYGVVEAALKSGQGHVPVHVFPFRMTQANLDRHAGSQWFAFWLNLKQGYDAFEAERLPPKVRVQGKTYRVLAL